MWSLADCEDVAVECAEPRYALVVRAAELNDWVPSHFGADWPLTWREVCDAWSEAIASPASYLVYAVVAAC